MAANVREVMTSGAECIGPQQTVTEAAQRLAELDVGAMPVCGEDEQVQGMITDRDIVVKVLAQGKNPSSTTVADLGGGEPATIGPDDSADDALRTMTDRKVRRLPVVEDGKVIGIVSQADIATHVDEEKVGELVKAISAAP
ncbi:MAG TPA: CBS domain-containing protein [Thermoleophilaceae bacterium]|jgi:CBS domain-containing protein